MWTTRPNRDSRDSHFPPSAEAEAVVSSIIRSWYNSQPGFISLQHDAGTFSTGIAIEAIQDISDLGTNFPLKIMPVGDCVNQNTGWYAIDNSPNETPSHRDDSQNRVGNSAGNNAGSGNQDTSSASVLRRSGYAIVPALILTAMGVFLY